MLTGENLDNEIRIVTEELRLATENDPMARLFHEAVRALLGETDLVQADGPSPEL